VRQLTSTTIAVTSIGTERSVNLGSSQLGTGVLEF